MNKIAELRKEKLISQEKLAEQVGLSRTYISEIENNKKQPNVKLAIKIAKVLGTSVESIFGTTCKLWFTSGVSENSITLHSSYIII
nr:helix-turn-helix transcriptional regulator [Bacillus cereus]